MVEKINKLIKNPLFFGSVIMVGGSMLSNVVNYLYHLAMGRILGPVDYGILASLFSIFYIIGIVPLSSSVSIVKFVSTAKNKKDVSKVYYGIKNFIFSLSLYLTLGVAIASPLIANFLHINNIIMVTLLAPGLFLIMATLVNQATCQGELKFMGFVVPGLVSSLGKLIFGLLFVWVGWSVFGAMVGIVLAGLLAYFSSTLFVKGLKITETKNGYNIKPFLKYAFPVLIQSLAFTSIFTMDVILVKHFLSPIEAGYYAAVSTLGKIIFFAVSPITSAMFPIVSKKKSKGEKYLGVFIVSLFSTILISLAILAVYYYFPNIAIGVLYGSEYLAMQRELVWMGLFMFFYTASYICVNFMLSLGKTLVVFIPLLASIMQVIAIYFLHGSILQVIQVSLLVMTVAFLVLALFLMYNRFVKDE